MDGIHESAAIGVSLIGEGSVGVAVVIAVFLSTFPSRSSRLGYSHGRLGVLPHSSPLRLAGATPMRTQTARLPTSQP